MAEVSAEPSMEDILSSIKRIISEEDAPAAARPRRPRAVPLAAVPDVPAPDEEVLELNDPMPGARDHHGAEAAEPARPEPIVSDGTAAAARGAIDALSRLVVKPEPGNDGTLEGLVREMLRPMLREWLDANLPPLVERIVAREIAKITGAGASR